MDVQYTRDFGMSSGFGEVTGGVCAASVGLVRDSGTSVGRLLNAAGFSLQGNRRCRR